MIAISEKPVIPYFEDYKPLEVRRNNERLTGWKQQEQSGKILAFNDTYDDTFLSVRLAGEISQTVTAQGKNLFDKNRVQDGFLSLETGLPEQNPSYPSSKYGAPIYIPANTPIVLSGTTTELRYRRYSVTGAYVDSIVVNSGVPITSANNFYIRPLFFSGISQANLDTIQIEVGSVATSYASFIPQSPSPYYPSPLMTKDPKITVTSINMLQNTSNFLNTRYYHAQASSRVSTMEIVSDPTYGSVMKWHYEVPSPSVGHSIFYHRYFDYWFNKFIVGQEYTISFMYKSTRNARIRICDPASTNIVMIFDTITSSNGKWVYYSSTKTALVSGNNSVIYFSPTDGVVTSDDFYVTNLQLEVGNTAHPYAVQSYIHNIDPLWEGDWYDAVTGEEYREKRYAIVDGVSSAGHGYAAGAAVEYARCISIAIDCPSMASRASSYVWCDKLPYIQDDSDVPHVRSSVTAAAQAFRMFLPKILLAGYTAAAINAYLAANPYHIVRIRQTPTTTQRTPIPIPTYPKHTVISAEGAQIAARCRVVDR